MKGKLLIFSAPSGSGKTTIVQHLLTKDYNLHFSVSATNRVARGKEQHGTDYYFLSTEEFKNKIEENEFLEWEEVYEGKFYGTLISEVERLRNEGKNVIFDVDVVGGCNIKEFYGDEALSVFIQPPSIDELKKRLVSRSTDTPEVIETRISKAAFELTFASKFDKIIINDKLEDALDKTEQVIANFLTE